MTLNRQYIPTIGKSVKLATWSDYTDRQINVWSWLRVKAINSEDATVEVLNGTESTGHVLNVPLTAIDKPIGWQQRYTIYVKDREQADKIINDWFKRGIVVRASCDLSNAGNMAFQPLTNNNAPSMPHWQYVENTDIVKAEDCSQVFKVVLVETEDLGVVPGLFQQDCKYCNGTGRDTAQRIATVRGIPVSDVVSLIEMPASEDERYRTSSRIQVEDWNAGDQTFACHCRYGTFRHLGRSERAKLVKTWEALG